MFFSGLVQHRARSVCSSALVVLLCTGEEYHPKPTPTNAVIKIARCSTATTTTSPWQPEGAATFCRGNRAVRSAVSIRTQHAPEKGDKRKQNKTNPKHMHTHAVHPRRVFSQYFICMPLALQTEENRTQKHTHTLSLKKKWLTPE